MSKEEIEEIGYINDEAKKSIFVEGFQIAANSVDQGIIKLGFLTITSANEPLIFSEIVLTTNKAKDLVKGLTETILEAEKVSTKPLEIE